MYAWEGAFVGVWVCVPMSITVLLKALCQDPDLPINQPHNILPERKPKDTL